MLLLLPKSPDSRVSDDGPKRGGPSPCPDDHRHVPIRAWADGELKRRRQDDDRRTLPGSRVSDAGLKEEEEQEETWPCPSAYATTIGGTSRVARE